MVITNDVQQWVKENRNSFQPPVCNKCMYSEQLKVFFVGGPNSRKDFHLEEGEEFFYQLTGDMCLIVVEKGVIKNIPIKQGEIFMLPGRTLHSPQRYENTIGLVVERTRAPFEWDSLRYLVGDTTEILFERWTHLVDIVTQLPPIIKEYFASEAHRTGKPTEDSVMKKRPYEPDQSIELESPINLAEWIQSRKEIIKSRGSLVLYGAPKYKTHVIVYGYGQHHLLAGDGELFLYEFAGSSSVTTENGDETFMKANHTLLLPPNSQASVNVSDTDGYLLTVSMPTPVSEHKTSN